MQLYFSYIKQNTNDLTCETERRGHYGEKTNLTCSRFRSKLISSLLQQKVEYHLEATGPWAARACYTAALLSAWTSKKGEMKTEPPRSSSSPVSSSLGTHSLVSGPTVVVATHHSLPPPLFQPSSSIFTFSV